MEAMKFKPVLFIAGATAVGLTSAVIAVNAANPDDETAQLPMPCDIVINADRTVTGTCADDPVVVTTTTGAPATTTTTTTAAATTTSTTVAPTTAAPTTTLAPTTTVAATTTTTVAPPSGATFAYDFSSADPNAWKTAFDHMWSGELHSGSAFGADRNGFLMDHDMACGNPNATHHAVNLGPGKWGQLSPADAEPAFMACLPGGNPESGHLMTAANTEGYIISWFAPKPEFTNVQKVCFDINMNWIGNGTWFQLVFLSQAEANKTLVIDGVSYPNVKDLGFTSPDFPGNNGQPSTWQGLAQNGIKFQVDGSNAGDARFGYKVWNNGVFGQPYNVSPGNGTNGAPRYTICVQDNENGTLTIANGAPDGLLHANTVPGNIPNGPTRVVFEHDLYNPDKHFTSCCQIENNSGRYTYHWDNVQVWSD